MRIELDQEDLDRLAGVIAGRVAELLREQKNDEGRWLDSADASRYLGISKTALHKLTASRQITFEQNAPGGKCWFRRADLDAYRRAG